MCIISGTLSIASRFGVYLYVHVLWVGVGCLFWRVSHFPFYYALFLEFMQSCFVRIAEYDVDCMMLCFCHFRGVGARCLSGKCRSFAFLLSPPHAHGVGLCFFMLLVSFGLLGGVVKYIRPCVVVAPLVWPPRRGIFLRKIGSITGAVCRFHVP